MTKRRRPSSQFAVALAIALAVPSCFAQSPEAQRHIHQLFEHWRWEQYWNGSTELGPLYQAGREVQALLFWRTGETQPGVGFCSIDLGICQYAQTLPAYDGGDRMKISAGQDLRIALKHFSTSAFEEDPHATVRVPIPDVAGLATEVVKISLPQLDPAEAIRDRKAPPRDQVQALVDSLEDCGGCKPHLWIPYFGANDPYVPVYIECAGCPKTIVSAMWAGDGHWWTPISSWNHDPVNVERTRRLIEKALMLEIGR